MFQFTSDLSSENIRMSGTGRDLFGEDIAEISGVEIDKRLTNTGSGSRLKFSQVLHVVQQSSFDGRPVLRVRSGNLILQGPSDTELLCGRCNSVLARGISTEQLIDVVLHCNYCGSLNDTENSGALGKGAIY